MSEKDEILVKVTAEPAPYAHEGYQIFRNAILEKEGVLEPMYLPLLLVHTGLDCLYETSEMEDRDGMFPVAFPARVVDGMEKFHDDSYSLYRVEVEYVGEDFYDVEPFQDWRDDAVYFEQWFQHCEREHSGVRNYLASHPVP
jgi:hypothetical protein